MILFQRILIASLCCLFLSAPIFAKEFKGTVENNHVNTSTTETSTKDKDCE
jgi:hypothetical protein